MNITRRMPPIVAQSLADSCWAAALESWSRVDPQINDVRQDALISTWGEGATGGITPALKIPRIAQAYHLGWGGFAPTAFEGYLRDHLRGSHVFCAYNRGPFLHAVLVYRLSDRGNVSYMDPDGGHDRWKPLRWFTQRGPYVLMRKL
jgi:hypothetical protein